MSREKWYVTNRHLNSAIGAIDGIRQTDKIAYAGTIVPGEWFKLVNDQIFDDLLVNGYEAITAYQPPMEELPLLYTLYPATRPKTVKAAEHGGLSLKNKWYRVPEHEAMVYGIAALVSIEGVCKAGDVAWPGDVIPAQWFAGLSIENIGRLERLGATSQLWLNGQDPSIQARYMGWVKPQILRIAPNIIELQNLYAKYPGANPNATPAIVSEDGD
jgi:hypothetical protein